MNVATNPIPTLNLILHVGTVDDRADIQNKTLSSYRMVAMSPDSWLSHYLLYKELSILGRTFVFSAL